MSWDEDTEDVSWGGAAGRTTGGPLEASDPPVAWLVSGGVAVVVGLAVSWLVDDVVAHVVGWFLGGFVAIVLWGEFVRRDARRRATGLSRVSPVVDRSAQLVLVGALVCVLMTSFLIADHVARLPW